MTNFSRSQYSTMAELLADTRTYITSDKTYGRICSEWADELGLEGSTRYTFLKECGAV